MLIRDGAELHFMQSDTLGQLASAVKMATAISNATLRLANYTCNGFYLLTCTMRRSSTMAARRAITG